MPHISIKQLAYDDTAIKSKDTKKDIHSIHSEDDYTKKMLLNYALAPIKPRASLVRITCAGYDNLIFCDIDSKQLQNITSTPTHFEMHHSLHLDSSSYSHPTLLDRLYQHCLNSGIFSQDMRYILTYMRLHSGVLRIFALKENSSHCDIIVPAVFLPFGLEQNPSGIFLLDDWLMFYENGKLLYDYQCIDAHTLEEALHFLKKAYGKSKPTISYLEDFATYALDSQNLHTLAEFRKLDIDMKKLCFDTVLRLSRHSGNMPKPLYNRARHSFLKTHSFWASIKSLACCTLIFALPFGKLIYTNHTETKSENLKAQNAITMKEFQHQKAQNAAIPQKLLRINSTIESLYSLRLPYTPRLEILSSISAIASKNSVWIVFLSLRDDNISKPNELITHTKGDINPAPDYQNLQPIQISYPTQAQNANLGLDLHIYANDEWRIQSFLSELKNSAHFAFVDFGDITQQNDCFTTQVFAKLF